MIRILIAAVLVATTLSQVPPPVWPEVFHQSFVESYNASRFRTSGRFYFDSKRDMTRIDRVDGQHNMICGSILPNVSNPCTHLIRDHKRWIVFPEKRTCCMCCDQAHGCGTLKRDWLNSAKYEGEQEHQGEFFYKWSILDGSTTEYYLATKSEERIPRRFDTIRDAQDYIMNTYSTEPIPDSVFALPDYCKSTCPATTICGKFQSTVASE